jgi:hypothetical protein
MRWLIAAFVLAAAVLSPAGPQAEATSVTGYVIDSACLFIKNLEKPVGKDCALRCAKAGSPLVILADDGTVYLPISSEMPAMGQNERLMRFAGERVTVRGKFFQRGGSHAVVIEEVGAATAGR